MSEVDSSPGDDRTVALAGSHVEKRFGHVQALVDASIKVHSGEIVALFGDNGAGKSTLLRILLGIYRPDSGEIAMNGVNLQMNSIRDAQLHGIEAVHQDLALAPDLSVIDNMFLGHEIVQGGITGRIGILARRKMAEQAEDALRQLAIKLPSVYVSVRDLSGGQRQAVAIARAVMWARAAVLLDEPTAALGARQSEIVCDLMRAIAARGLAVLVVSHDLPRILKVADRVTILWRGRTARDEKAADLTVPDVVAAMVGYEGNAA